MTTWNNDAAMEMFTEFWKGRPATVRKHSAALWDQRAKKWDSELRTDKIRKDRSDARIANVTSYLLSNGALCEGYDVIDIGCGPGRFVAEFSKYVKHATGTDLSQAMCDFGTEYSKENGITNTDFVACDFKAIDIKEMGWEKAFDLVYSSITPAMNTVESIDKANQISRKWCFNGTFVQAFDELAEDISRDVFGRPLPKKWNGRSFYALYNVLWLKGYFPRVSYYDENSRQIYEADLDTAIKFTEICEVDPDNEEAVEKVLRYLEQKKAERGILDYANDFKYSWCLWDVTEKTDRDTYNL